MSMNNGKKLILGVSLACATLWSTSTIAATQAQINNAITDGLSYLWRVLSSQRGSVLIFSEAKI